MNVGMENKQGGWRSAEQQQMKEEEAQKVKIKKKKRERSKRLSGMPHSPIKSFDFPIS